jgi:hypothetical protein
MASGSHRFPTYHIPDDGTRYAPGEVITVDQSSGRIRIVKDPEGTYEVMNCRPATEYDDGPPLLRIGLRKREAPQADGLAPWSQERLSRW